MTAGLFVGACVFLVAFIVTRLIQRAHRRTAAEFARQATVIDARQRMDAHPARFYERRNRSAHPYPMLRLPERRRR